MMKKCVSLMAAALLLFTLCVSAEEPELYNETVLSDGSRIVYTAREAHAAPRWGTVYSYGNCGVLAPDGTWLVEPTCQQILPPVENRAPFRDENGLWGYFDENWQMAIEPRFRSARNFSEGLAAVADLSWIIGFIDLTGQLVIPFTYADVSAFQDGVATVSTAEEGYYFNTFYRQGKINREGQLVEPLIFHFEETSFPVVMSENLIEVGGVSYDNSTLSYPFINYLGYSYIPLTYGTCRAMGIRCDFSEETGLVLSIGSEAALPEQGENTMQRGVYDEAVLYGGTLTIEGKTYTAGDFYYPLLFYRDIVYLPVLYREGMERLGISYRYFRDDTGAPDPPRQGSMIFERY